MKQKHKDAMIAMGIKIAALEQLLKNHGQAHMEQDLLPQFGGLVTKVEKIEGSLNYKLNDGPIHNHSIRIAKLENYNLPALVDDHIKRLADHDESIEALSETVDQLSTCKCEAGNQMLKRIAELEARLTDQGKRLYQVETRIKPMDFDHSQRIVNLETRMDGITKGDLVLIAEHVDNLDESNRVFLRSVPDIEILKVQTHGAIRDVDTLKIQMHNLLPVHNNMMTEVLKQKKFLEKVQAILDRERDDRIKQSPGYKKEIAAMKMDANAPKDATGRSRTGVSPSSTVI